MGLKITVKWERDKRNFFSFFPEETRHRWGMANVSVQVLCLYPQTAACEMLICM